VPFSSGIIFRNHGLCWCPLLSYLERVALCDNRIWALCTPLLEVHHVLCSHEGPLLASFVRYFCKCVLCLKRDFTAKSVNCIFQENYSYLRIFHNFLTLWHLDIAFIMNSLFFSISWNSNLDSWKSRFKIFLQDAKSLYWGMG